MEMVCIRTLPIYIYIAIYISKEGDINSTLLRLCMAVHAAMLHVREESMSPWC